MKFSVATVVAFAAAVLGKPILLNSAYDVQENVPFTLQWNNAQGPVSIELMTGTDPNHLRKIGDITSGQTGTSYTYVPSSLPSGTYAFRITDSTGANYSPSFQYQGTGTLPSSSASVSSTSLSVTSTSASASSTDSSSSSSAGSSTITSSSSSNSTTTSSGSSTTSAPSSSITTSTSTTSTTRQPSSSSTPPNSNVGQRFASPLAFVLVTVAALVFFN